MIIHVLIAQRDGEHPLGHHRAHLVDHPVLRPAVAEAHSEAIDQTDRPVRRAQEQRPGVRGHRPAVERRHHATPFDAGKAGA